MKHETLDSNTLRRVFQQKLTSKHITPDSNTSKTSAYNSTACPLKTLLSVFPCEAGPNDGRLGIRIVLNIIQALRRYEHAILNTCESVVWHMAT